MRKLGWILLLLLPAFAVADDAQQSPDDRRIQELRIHTDGADDPSAWQHQTDDQQAQAVARLKTFGAEAQKIEHLKMRLMETSHFLIYTDTEVAANLVHEDAGYLEAAYSALNKVFGVKAGDAGQGATIWQGKALFFIFSDNDIAQDFVKTVYHQETAVSPMMDIAFQPLVRLSKSGSVAVVAAQINLFRDSKREMVLAMADAYLFRLRSDTLIAPWVEAGLVLAIADSIHYQSNQNAIPDAELARMMRADTANYLRNNDINRLLGATYPPAPWACEGLISFLIGQSPSQMTKFVLAMKDGKGWQDAMKDVYQLTPADLKAAFLNAAGNGR